MNEDRFPSRPAAEGAVAGFSLPGFWQANQDALLLALAVLAAAVVLIIWLRRARRRQERPATLIEEAGEAPGLELGETQIEGLAEDGGGVPPSGPSPGLYGKIEVLVGGQAIGTYLVTDNPLAIGRDPGQSLVIIQEPIVSKLHCQILVRQGQVFVRDLQSTNGVYVNEEKVGERQLQDNDVIFLGKKGTVRIVYHR